MSYTDFAEKLLIALYQESETGASDQKFGDLVAKYGLGTNTSWVQRVAEEWDRNGFVKVDAHIGSPLGWYAEISGPGMRYVEGKYGAKTGVGTILEPTVPIDERVPASDRFVSLNHNQIVEAENHLDNLVEALDRSNGLPEEPTFRQRIIGQIKAGRELIRAGEYKLAILQMTLVTALNEIVQRYKEGVLVNLASNLLQYFLTNGLSS